MNKTKTEMLLGITSICSFSFLQEKHIRRPYLAFDDVLGDALQVKSLKNIQSYLASSMFIACLIGSRLKRCRENIFLFQLIPSCYNAPMVMKDLHVDTPSIYFS